MLRMREATITAGILITLGVGGLGGVYVGLTWDRPHRPALTLLFALAVASAALVAALPAERIVRSRLREPFFLSWTMLDFALLVVGTLVDGGTASPLVIVFFLPVIFSSMSYPVTSVIAVGAASVASYLSVALIAGGSSLAHDVAFATALACTGAIGAWQAQNHKRQHEALTTMSRTDALTGCLNRRGFQERAVAEVAAMLRRGRSGALVVLDIDHFKPVNDMFGHAAGDELLCWVTHTLQRVVRPGDSVGRIGGDEFAVLFAEIDAAGAHAIAARISEALRERAPASLGLAEYPREGTTLDELTRKADMELYASREGQRGRGGTSRTAPANAARGPAESAQSGEGPSEQHGYGPIDLWRAALDAMPSQAGGTALEDSGVSRALLDQIDACVIVTDMAGLVICWNHGAEALYGWSGEEAIGHNARDLVVPDDAAAAERLVVELLRDGSWDGELLVRRKDGSLFTAYVRNRLLHDENGEPSTIVGVAVDISSRVAVETELVQSRNYARAVTDWMGEGLFTVDIDERVTYVNRAAQAILGRSAEELRGAQLSEAIHPRAGEPSVGELCESPISEALEREETVRVEDDQFLGRDGRPIPVAYTAAPFRTEDGLQGCVVIFSDISERKRRESEQRADLAKLEVINRVERALLDESFVLHAQPIVDLRTGETVQHELLLRMREADGTLVAPREFLPVAEQYALIGEIDWWVIKQATRIAGAGQPVQLNISARSVGDLDVLEHVERCIQQCGVRPGTLVFEITETAIVDDQHAARTFVEGLHALGCKVALDDFGTGYGTLTYLKQIPVDHLKLDIEFVADLAYNTASRHVVEAVLALARDFGLAVVAEGVEDTATLTLLSDLGVDYAQGFHIGRPAPFAERPGDLAAPFEIQAAHAALDAGATRPRGERQLEPHRSSRRPAGLAGQRRS